MPAILASLALSVSPSALAQKAALRVAYVTDGDTFRLTTGERIRIAGIDAPEIHEGQARCRLEIERGLTASRALRAMIDDQIVTIERVGRSYNRTVARVRFQGRDLAVDLVRRDIARPWPRRSPKPNWCS